MSRKMYEAKYESVGKIINNELPGTKGTGLAVSRTNHAELAGKAFASGWGSDESKMDLRGAGNLDPVPTVPLRLV